MTGPTGAGPESARRTALLPELVELVEHHRRSCPAYARVLDAIGHGADRRYRSVADLPWLPVRMFKEHELSSVPDADITSVLSSSGTTGRPSRVRLDAAASRAQQRALLEALRPVTGPRRLPMLIVDSADRARPSRQRTARGAGVLGVMNAGRDHTFVLDNDDRLDLAALRAFLERRCGEPFLVFGFTYLVWTRLIERAVVSGIDLTGGVLVHSGGWKRLEDRRVDAATLRATALAAGLTATHDFYGMVEQIGVVHVEGETPGRLHPPPGAEVIVRDPRTWREAALGETGLIQVVSTLPRSYPGHSLLTEDLGVAYGTGERPVFSVLGRVPRAEPRGCSDTGAAP